MGGMVPGKLRHRVLGSGEIGVREVEYKAGMSIRTMGVEEVGVWGNTEEWGNRSGNWGMGASGV